MRKVLMVLMALALVAALPAGALAQGQVLGLEVKGKAALSLAPTLLMEALGYVRGTGQSLTPWESDPVREGFFLGGAPAGRSVGEIWAEIQSGSSNWRSVAVHVEPARRGGVSIQELYTNGSEKIWVHTVYNRDGTLRDGPHPRPYYYDGAYSGTVGSRYYFIK